MLSLLLATLLTASAADHDGTWEMVSLTSPSGVQTAEETYPEGCTSQELWSFDKGLVMRGHRESCAKDDGIETCEVWVEVMASDAPTILVPYTTEALSQVNTAVLNETTKKGATTTREVKSKRLCGVRLDKATWEAKVEGDQLKLTLAGGGVEWLLKRSK